MVESEIIKVAALTSGKNVPSTRFRIRQHIDSLQKAGIDVCEYVPMIDKSARLPGITLARSPKYVWPIYTLWQAAKLLTRIPGIIGSWKAQITWLSREIMPGYPTLEPLLKRPYVLDVDDAIWLWQPFGRSTSKLIAKSASIVLAGNTYLANWFSSYARDVRIVPTAIDTDRFLPRKFLDSNRDRRFTVGWTGLSINFKYLYKIEMPLESFLENHKDSELLIIADKPPNFQRLPNERVRYIKWSPSIEAEAVRQMDVGIMPLPNNDWTKGKCSFKMLQYMASGVPVVVSPVGMNVEVLSLGRIGFAAKSNAEWYEALDFLYKDRDLAHKYGLTGRLIAEKHFSRSVVSANIALIFKELYSASTK